MRYNIVQETGLTYTWHEREAILKDLSNKIYILGATKFNGQYLHVRKKTGANVSNIKSILRKHFNIEYKGVYGCDDKYNYYTAMFAKEADIIKLCKCYLECNMDLDYRNRFDPLGERNTISKQIYQYGKVRYDLLAV